MTTRNMLIIKDASGEIIAAQVEQPAGSDIVAYMTPADPQHTVHRVLDIPAELHDRVHPAEFHKLLTEHVNSDHAQVTQTSAEELYRSFSFFADRK
jgi:hypothetical protein